MSSFIKLTVKHCSQVKIVNVDEIKQVDDVDGAARVKLDGEWIDVVETFKQVEKMLIRDMKAEQVFLHLLSNPGGPVQACPMRATGFQNGDADTAAGWSTYIAEEMLKVLEEEQ